MKKTLPALFALALSATVLAASAADAPGAAAGGMDMGACKADADKLCSGIQPGEGRIAACFKEHRKDLSADCKKELMAARKSRGGGKGM